MNIQETIKINMNIVEAVREIAEKEGKTKSEIYRRAIELYLSENEKIVNAQIEEGTIVAKDLINYLERLGKIQQKRIDKRKEEKIKIENKKKESSENEKIKLRKREINFGKTIYEAMHDKKTLWYKHSNEWFTTADRIDYSNEGYVKKNQIPKDLMIYYDAYVDTL